MDRAVVLGKCQARGHVRYRTPFGQLMPAAKFGRRGAKDGRQFTYGARERLLKPLNRADGNFLANNGGIERAISGLQRMEQRIGMVLLVHDRLDPAPRSQPLEHGLSRDPRTLIPIGTDGYRPGLRATF